MHVFLSYARSSEAQAAYAEQALRDAGYVVWRDSELPAHLSYADVIEERLKSAKAVLVLWSAEAAKSQWVRAEADAARELGTLIQSSVDGTVPPIPFNQIQCADLSGWSGESDHAGWRKLKASVIALAGQAEAPVKAVKRPARSICVLPFQNMSSDEVPDYFCDGISEDITSELSKVKALKVIPRKSAFKFKGQDVDPCNVAEELSVGHVLEGTVRRAGDRVRITAQLVDGITGEIMWTDRYYREFNDVFSVQEELSKAIVDDFIGLLLPRDEQAGEDRDDSADADGVKTKKRPSKEAKAAPLVEPKHDEIPAPQAAVPATPVSILDQSFDEQYAPEAAEAEEEWSTEEEWVSDEDWDDSPSWKDRIFGSSDNAPRLIALALILVMGALAFRYFYWPQRDIPIVKEEKTLTYTVTATVNVRSLPSRYNSRILGTLEKGATINIAPDLAGAQPDWLKIIDGPYVGGYVWRESTRPVTGTGADGLPDPAVNATQRKDATG